MIQSIIIMRMHHLIFKQKTATKKENMLTEAGTIGLNTINDTLPYLAAEHGRIQTKIY